MWAVYDEPDLAQWRVVRHVVLVGGGEYDTFMSGSLGLLSVLACIRLTRTRPLLR